MHLSELMPKLVLRKQLCKKTENVYWTTIKQLTKMLSREPTVKDFSDDLLLEFAKFLDDGKRATFTIRERVCKVRAMWRFASDCGHIRIRPTVPPPRAIASERPKAFSHDELVRLVEACDRMPGAYLDDVPAADYWKAWIITCYSTGERRGALMALRWEWVELEPRIIDIPGNVRKAGKPALYRLPEWAIPPLQKIRRPRDLVFQWEKNESSFFHHFNWLLRMAGLPTGRRCQSQKLRRTHLTVWAANGGDPTKRAQHSNAAITQKHYLDQAFLPEDNPEDRLRKLA